MKQDLKCQRISHQSASRTQRRPDFDLTISKYTFVLQFQSVPLVREKLELGRAGEKVPTHLFSNLAGIFGIHFRQIAELPRLLAFVKIPLVGLLYLHHFNLDRPLRSDLDRKATEFQTHRQTLLFSIIIGGCVCVFCTCGTQEAVLLFLSSLADINDAEEALVIGREDVPLESVLDGCHGGCCLTQHNTSLTHCG